MHGSVAVARLIRSAYIAGARWYHRLDVEIEAPMPETPCLIVANHGFGGIFDLNIYATLGALQRVTDRPVRVLTHQLAWTCGVGEIVEQVGAVPATRQSAFAAFDRGEHVLVLPGGDHDAAKPWWRRNEIVFHGRTGFADVAVSAEVPIVPVVTAGAGESLLVLSDGARLARWLGLQRRFRAGTLPVTLSIPWGLNVGLVALVPYLPLPTKLDTVVLPAIWPGSAAQPEDLAEEVRAAMQATLTRITRDRTPVLGSIGPTRRRPTQSLTPLASIPPDADGV